MTTVEIHVRCKFRSWGITWWTVDKRVKWSVPVMIPGGHVVLLDDCGLLIEVSV